MDASRRVRCVLLAVGGGVDLSVIALLYYTCFCFCSRVFGGVIVACLTKLERRKGLLLLSYRVHSLHSFIINS